LGGTEELHTVLSSPVPQGLIIVLSIIQTCTKNMSALRPQSLIAVLPIWAWRTWATEMWLLLFASRLLIPFHIYAAGDYRSQL